MCKTNHKKTGESLEHGNAHTQAHNSWSRRNFLYSMGVMGGGTMTLSGLPVASLGLSPLAVAGHAGLDISDRVLVMIRLKGGNDGLNTIIPTFDYGTYQSNRPNIAIPQDESIPLTSEFAIQNVMSPLMPLWEDGQMKVINSVGYEDPNLSHFESIDIWSTGNKETSPNRSGWLGRYYTEVNPDYIENPSTVPPAVKIGGANSLLYYDDNQVDLGFNVGSANELSSIGDTGTVFDLNANTDPCYYGEQVEFLRTMANSTFRYAEVISEAFNEGTNAVEYQTRLGNQLSLVSRLIKGGLGTKLYLVTLDGFDTHVNQGNDHANLMEDLSSAVASFYEDLKADNLNQDVLTMTFSEFGRRVQQNASNGTDHGTAAPVLLFGPGLNGSDILGDNPDLGDLDNVGNLKFGTDFRSIYASVLEYWLCLDASSVDQILGQNYSRMELGLDCSIVNVNTPIRQELMHSSYQSNNQLYIKVNLARPDHLKIELYSILGQQLSVIHQGYVQSGIHTFSTPVGHIGMIPVVYRITNGKNQYSDKVVLR